MHWFSRDSSITTPIFTTLYPSDVDIPLHNIQCSSPNIRLQVSVVAAMNPLSKPWIVNYLIQCAKLYGTDSWPPNAKPKTVQIIKVFVVLSSSLEDTPNKHVSFSQGLPRRTLRHQSTGPRYQIMMCMFLFAYLKKQQPRFTGAYLRAKRSLPLSLTPV